MLLPDGSLGDGLSGAPGLLTTLGGGGWSGDTGWSGGGVRGVDGGLGRDS